MRRLILAAVGELVVLATCLLLLGRRAWCACGSWNPFSTNIHSSHNSQHLLDPYSFTHILHGVLLYGLLWVVARHLPVGWRAVLALSLEALWELLENSPPVIERFRQSTVSLNYTGDSIGNSLGDCLSCAVGFGLAAVLPTWGSVVLFLVTEAALYLWIKDGLILAFLSILFPRR